MKVEPNPTLETLEQVVALVREQGVDFILGVGGGSVSDGAKFVACAALYDGDGWDIVSGKHAPRQALCASPCSRAGAGGFSVVALDSYA